MKFKPSLLLLSILLVACSNNTASTTRVRLLELRVSSNNLQVNVRDKSLKRLGIQPSVVESKSDLILPGDQLTFTIELEDPNFEFLSLLAVNFNDTLLRANSDDSIFSTRDCGLNICIDFPFVIQEGISTYTVNEVRFAKINVESGVSALINDSSINSIELDVYEEDVLPNVLEAVDTINAILENSPYKSTEAIKEEVETANSIHEYVRDQIYARSLKIIDSENYFSSNGFNEMVFPSEIDESFGLESPHYESGFSPFQQVAFFHGSDFEFIHLLYEDMELLDSHYSFLDETMNLFLGLLDDTFSETFVYNEGNTIYISINGESTSLLTLERDSRIEPYLSF